MGSSSLFPQGAPYPSSPPDSSRESCKKLRLSRMTPWHFPCQQYLHLLWEAVCVCELWGKRDSWGANSESATPTPTPLARCSHSESIQSWRGKCPSTRFSHTPSEGQSDSQRNRKISWSRFSREPLPNFPNLEAGRGSLRKASFKDGLKVCKILLSGGWFSC